jgi:hypothetical protein
MRRTLSRRALLAGAGGVTIGLPFLEAMLGPGRTHAQDPALPKRYAIVFAGQALGGDGYPNDQSVMGGVRTTETGHYIVPASTGAAWEMTTPLLPLMAQRDQFSIVSGMRIPYSTSSTAGTDVPPGGAYRDFHGGGASPLLSGVRSIESRFTSRGITSDQLVANLNAAEGLPVASLVLRAQPAWYISGCDLAGREYISYRGDADPIEAQTSPRVAFDALFRGFVPPDDEAARQRADFDRRSRRSVLDVVLSRHDRVLRGVSSADRIRLEEHYDQIRALELRVAMIPDPPAGLCMAPADPGTDPGIGGNNTGSGGADIVPGLGYSEEDTRARVMADIIHMAFVCDMTRAATLQITSFQSHMSVLPITTAMGMPIHADLHENGHNGDPDNRGQHAVSLTLGWHVGHYAYLLDKLAQTAEGDGTVLDSSCVVFMPEAGHGRQLNDAVSDFATHSVERMVMLVGGRAGGLMPGRHIDAAGAHPAQCLVSAMQSVGRTEGAFGEVTGEIPELFG